MEELIQIDTTEKADIPMQEVSKPDRKPRMRLDRAADKRVVADKPINCLRNERVTVKFIPNETGGLDRKHPYYGGKVEGAFTMLTVPMLKNGTIANPLTKAEKEYLEEIMQLDYGALSVYKKEDNYWENLMVRLGKDDTILDLSVPTDYIKYKVLLANKDIVCPSIKDLEEKPKATYQHVMVSDSDVFTETSNRTSNKMRCYEEFGRVRDDKDVLRCIIHTITGRQVDINSKVEFMRDKIVDMIDNNPKRFLEVITDPLLHIKVTLMRGVEEKVVSRRGEYYYYDGQPLCGDNEAPTITVAAKWLGLPKNQELLFSIQAKTK